MGLEWSSLLRKPCQLVRPGAPASSSLPWRRCVFMNQRSHIAKVSTVHVRCTFVYPLNAAYAHCGPPHTFASVLQVGRGAWKDGGRTGRRGEEGEGVSSCHPPADPTS
jgi:hypothetical protein